jgi:lipoate-protein ligase B
MASPSTSSRTFTGIVPCGISAHGVTSLVDLGVPATMADLDAALKVAFDEVFGPDGSFSRREGR